MTADKVKKVLGIYRDKFTELQIGKTRYFVHVILKHNRFRAGLAHCCCMIDEMEVFLEQGRMEKVFRWLGFVQGVLWALGVYTIQDLKEHNMPNEAEVDENLSLGEIIKDGTMNDPC